MHLLQRKKRRGHVQLLWNRINLDHKLQWLLLVVWLRMLLASGPRFLLSKGELRGSSWLTLKVFFCEDQISFFSSSGCIIFTWFSNRHFPTIVHSITFGYFQYKRKPGSHYGKTFLKKQFAYAINQVWVLFSYITQKTTANDWKVRYTWRLPSKKLLVVVLFCASSRVMFVLILFWLFFSFWKPWAHLLASFSFRYLFIRCDKRLENLFTVVI